MTRPGVLTYNPVRARGGLRLLPHGGRQLPVPPRRVRNPRWDTKPTEKLSFWKHQVQPGKTVPHKNLVFRTHKVEPSDPEKIKKHSFRKHHVQPHFDQRIEEHPSRRDERFRLYWRKSGLVKAEPVDHSRAERKEYGIIKQLHSQLTGPPYPRLKSNSIREPSVASTQNESRTSEWLSRFASDVRTVVPKQLSRIEFPAGIVAEPIATPSVPRKRRTNEDKANVEAVLITPVLPLGEYVSAEMIDMIRMSPYHDPRQDAVIVRTHAHRTRGQNALGCFKLLTTLIKNVANEIVYREQRIAAEEKIYREEGAYDDPE